MGELLSVPCAAPSPEPFVTAAELAALMGVSRRTIARWVNQGCSSETWAYAPLLRAITGDGLAAGAIDGARAALTRTGYVQPHEPH